MQENINVTNERPAPKFELFESVLILCSASSRDNPNKNFGVVFAQIFDANDLHDSPEKLGWSYRVVYPKTKSNHEAIFRENELEKMPDCQDEMLSIKTSNCDKQFTTMSKLRPEDFPKPKFPLGTEVLVTAPDASGVPFVSVRRVVGAFLNPNLPNLEPFKCLGWLYLTEHEEEHEGRYQTLAKEADISLPVAIEYLPNALEGIVADLERLHASGDLWARQAIDLPSRIDEIQDSVRALIEEIEDLRDRPPSNI